MFDQLIVHSDVLPGVAEFRGIKITRSAYLFKGTALLVDNARLDKALFHPGDLHLSEHAVNT